MRNLFPNFTMRKDGVLPRGDWFSIQNKKDEPSKIYIYDEIGFWGTEASEFVKQLNEVEGGEIELHLNSPGGEVFDGLAIFNALKQHKANVTVYVDGLAASAASFVAQAGDKVVMARNAQMMIHDGIAFAYGNEKDMLDTAALLSTISNNIADIYAYRAGKRGSDATMEDFRALMREEVWYTGSEAVEAGLADEVLDQDDEAADTAKNKWDLGIYNHAGRERAESPLRVQARIQLSNRTKEMDMARKVTNSDDTETETPATETPAEETPVEETPAEETPVEEAPVEAPAAPASEAPAQPTNKVAGVIINGQRVTDWSAVQNHITSLENSQQESETVHRTNFVKKLATDNKIPASQIDSLTELVNGTDDRPGMTAEQFAAFSASYESLPASNLFTGHEAAESSNVASGTSNGKLQGDALKNRIEILEGTVAMQSRTMSSEDAKNTKSYIELQSLRAQMNNDN